MHKNTITQYKHKKLKPGLVASYNIWPGNGDGLSLFLALHKFVTYFLTYTLTHLLTAQDRHGTI